MNYEQLIATQVRKAQIKGIKYTQVAWWYNRASEGNITQLNAALLGNKYQYLGGTGKRKVTDVVPTEYAVFCKLNGKEVFMCVFNIKGKETPCFQTLDGSKLNQEDMMLVPVL